MLPGFETYDGGLPGVVVDIRQLEDGQLVWNGGFIPVQSGADFAKWMQDMNRSLE
jgi:hypothetical protein